MRLADEIENKKEFKTIILPVVYDYQNKRNNIFKNTDRDTLRERLCNRKKYSTDNIGKLKKEAIENLTKHGIKVYEAKDQTQARKILGDIIGKEKKIIKSKTNVGSEIDIKELLKDKEIIETDVGDFIAEICEEIDGHPVLPAMAITPKTISTAIKNKLGADVQSEPEEIVKFAREHIRKQMEGAKIGITGANAITSDGTVMILENEGNISLVSRLPDKHIIITGNDRIVATREDAMLVAECAAIFGTGQDIPMYVNFISGPSKTADVQNKVVTGAQGAKEVHVILMDNGRSKLLQSEFRELLHCISCGACLNFCPIYHQIAKGYGSKYAGARGVLFSAYNEDFDKAYNSGAFYCTMCRNCSDNCPAKIDLAGMMKKLRQKLAEQGIEPKQAKEMIENVKKHGNPFGKVEKGKTPKSLYCC